MNFNSVTLYNIFSNLDIKDLFNCSLTNKQFNKAANYDIIWEQLIDKHYGIDLDFMKKTYKITQHKLIYKKIRELIFIETLYCTEDDYKFLPKLQMLDLNDNQLKELPKEIGSLVNLQIKF